MLLDFLKTERGGVFFPDRLVDPMVTYLAARIYYELHNLDDSQDNESRGHPLGVK